MKRIPLILFLVCSLFLVSGPLIAQEAKVTSLMLKPLPDIPGKELMITIDYPHGGHDPVHRHDANSVIYVPEGRIMMGLNGGKPVTLTPGQTFYEGLNDIHNVGRNARNTSPVKF